MIKKYNFRKFDILLVLMVVAVVIFGIVAIGSATKVNTDLGTNSYVRKQIIGLLLGLFLMLVLTFIDYKFIAKFYIPMYLLMVGLLLAVEVAGVYVNSAKRWVVIAGFRMQPSEFTKLLLILFIASVIHRFEEQFNKLWFLVILAAFSALPIVLVNKQPDLSTSIVIAVIFILCIFSAGLDFRYVLVAVIIGVPLLVFTFWYIQQPDQQLLESYQVDRVMGLVDSERVDPDDLRQTENSKWAIGTGQLYGKGLYQGKINKYNYLPEPQTDFIFSIIGEEFGFIGCSSLLAMILLILLKILWIGRSVEDTLARTIIGGIVGMIGFQTFVNVGVVTGMLPNTGLPFPFVSAGISSLLTNMIAIGIVLNIGIQRKTADQKRRIKRNS